MAPMLLVHTSLKSDNNTPSPQEHKLCTAKPPSKPPSKSPSKSPSKPPSKPPSKSPLKSPSKPSKAIHHPFELRHDLIPPQPKVRRQLETSNLQVQSHHQQKHKHFEE
ncbi:hypothetical protein ACFX12_018841 [Malus domestica]